MNNILHASHGDLTRWKPAHSNPRLKKSDMGHKVDFKNLASAKKNMTSLQLEEEVPKDK